MTRTGTEPADYVTTRELCRRLSISRATVRRHGLSQFGIFVGNGWRYRLADVIRYYEQQPDAESTESP